MAKTFTKKEVRTILDSLDRAYPTAGCALDHYTPYQLLVAVTLSAQTTDARVNQVTPELFRRYPDAKAMAQADVNEVMDIIHSVGMYKTKSQRIIDQAADLLDRFDGEVPRNDEDLRSLPGVGRKTANVVMAEAFGGQRIAVDTHVFRVSNRIGLAKAKNVEKTEDQLMEILPEEEWTHAHHLLIFHGRYCCHARKPDCENCPIEDLCRMRRNP